VLFVELLVTLLPISLASIYNMVILCQLSQPVNPPSQIFLKFHKQMELFMLITKKQNFIEIG